MNPLQTRIKDRLAAQSYFLGPPPIPIVTVDDGDIENVIEQKVTVFNGGLAVTVLLPFGQNLEPNKPGVNLELNVEVSVVEHYHINRGKSGTQKPGYEAIRQIMKGTEAGGLHFWNPGPPYQRLELVGFEETSVKTPKATLLIYIAQFRIKEIFL